MSNHRWDPTSGYEFTKQDGVYLILRRGGKYVRTFVAPNEVSLTVMAETKDYDYAVSIVQALRATLPEEPTP